MTRSGARHEGSRWEKAAVRKLLTNVTYIGKIEYRSEVHGGEQQGIVDDDLFARVGEMLGEGRRNGTARGRNKHGFLLRGLIRCIACGSVMTSSVTAPRGKPYRYYTCTGVNRRGRTECPVRTVPAEALERFVVDRIREMGTDPLLLRDTLDAIAADREQEKPGLQKEADGRRWTVHHRAARRVGFAGGAGRPSNR